MRIMHRLSISGPTHHAANLTTFMHKKFDTMLLTGMLADGEKDGSFILQELGIQPYYIQSMKRSINPFQDIKALFEIYRWIQKEKPVIVHTHAAKSGTLGRLAAIIAGVPIIIHTFHGHTFHSYFNKLVTKVFISIERFLASKSTRIIAISEIQKMEIGMQFKICPMDKIEVIPLGFDLQKMNLKSAEKRKEFREQWLIAEDEIAIGIVGRLANIKHHTLFFDCFAALLHRTNKKIKGIIVGDGELIHALKQYCTTKGLRYCTQEDIDSKANIIFTSWQKKIDVVINGLDIVTLTSLNEGTPVTLIEAMAAAKPIVSTNVGGIADFVVHGKNGFLTETKDQKAFTEYLEILVNNTSHFGDLSDSAKKIQYQFSYKRLVDDMEKLYDELLQEKGLAWVPS